MEQAAIGEALGLSRIWLGMLQLAQMSVEETEAAELIALSLSLGINTFDCAREYGGHSILAKVMEDSEVLGARKIVIVDKSRARSYEDIETAVAESLVELNQEQIDIYMLHDVRGKEDFELRAGAWKYLLEAREMGLVHAVGISTHTVEGVKLAAEVDGLDIVQAPFNEAGIGILDGDTGEMERAFELAKVRGKMTCAFKVFGGGALFRRWKEALRFVLKHRCVDFVCIGATTIAEVKAIVTLLNQPEANLFVGSGLRQQVMIADWCIECGMCIQACPSGALAFDGETLWVDESKCTLCSACVAACLEEAIFIVHLEQ
ncbi:MAG: aldo/keto reductase [Armatimonadota bacterium]|nr:aldo/keto reductase [Armatimonadota bacterium]MCX7776702.1 aldo/keto reductase [Armatimonadota bacterium]MDW8026340.1 aldo/keto reductase [Armatimonadota bacterium]